MPKIPNEIIDKILIKLNNVHLAIKLRRNYVIKTICHINHYNIDYISMEGHLDVIVWLHNNEYKPTSDSIVYASWFGHLEVAKYLHSIGVKCDIHAMNKASEKGYLDIVIWLYNNGIKGNISTMRFAVSYGHLEVVKYLHSIGVNYDKREAIIIARSNKHTKIVEFLESV